MSFPPKRRFLSCTSARTRTPGKLSHVKNFARLRDKTPESARPTKSMQAFSVWVGLFVAAAMPVSAAQYSQLWGDHGEQWSPQGRLPDFSFAGYHSGEKPLPKVAAGV